MVGRDGIALRHQVAAIFQLLHRLLARPAPAACKAAAGGCGGYSVTPRTTRRLRSSSGLPRVRDWAGMPGNGRLVRQRPGRERSGRRDRDETRPGAGGSSARSKQGLSRSTLTGGLQRILRFDAGVWTLELGQAVTVRGASHRGRSLPISAASSSYWVRSSTQSPTVNTVSTRPDGASRSFALPAACRQQLSSPAALAPSI